MIGCCASSWRPMGVSIKPGATELHAPAPATPSHRGATGGADHAALGHRVREAAVGVRARGAIEELRCERPVEQVVLAGFDERRDLIRGRRRETDGRRSGHDELFEGVEQQLRADEVDREHTAGVGHRRRDAGRVRERPKRSELPHPRDERVHRGRIGDVARDADGAVDVGCVQVDRDSDVGETAQGRHACTPHAAPGSGDDRDRHRRSAHRADRHVRVARDVRHVHPAQAGLVDLEPSPALGDLFDRDAALHAGQRGARGNCARRGRTRW